MKSKLATWYMERAWVNMGPLRNVPLFHKLFNLAYHIRCDEYIAQIMAAIATDQLQEVR